VHKEFSCGNIFANVHFEDREEEEEEEDGRITLRCI
jgi:hypothetical protein